MQQRKNWTRRDLLAAVPASVLGAMTVVSRSGAAARPGAAAPSQSAVSTVHAARPAGAPLATLGFVLAASGPDSDASAPRLVDARHAPTAAPSGTRALRLAVEGGYLPSTSDAPPVTLELRLHAPAAPEYPIVLWQGQGGPAGSVAPGTAPQRVVLDARGALTLSVVERTTVDGETVERVQRVRLGGANADGALAHGAFVLAATDASGRLPRWRWLTRAGATQALRSPLGASSAPHLTFTLSPDVAADAAAGLASVA